MLSVRKKVNNMKLRNLLMCMYEDVIAGNIHVILIKTHTYQLFMVDQYTTREDLMTWLNSYGRKNVLKVNRDDIDCHDYTVLVSDI